MTDMIFTALSAVCLFAGILIIAIAILGVAKFSFIMNRMHCAALIDALGLTLILAGLMLACRSLDYIPKLFMVLLFQWIGSPIASHMVGRLEVRTEKSLAEHMKLPEAPGSEEEHE